MSSSISYSKDFKTKFYKNVMPKIYGIGASVVIAGAMFKLLNWPGGSLMLGLGLTTEAIIFFLSSFEPQEKEIDWTKVYPELLEGYQGGVARHNSHADGPIGEKLDAMFSQAKIDDELIEKLGQGMQRLSESVANLASMHELSATTVQFEKELTELNDKLAALNKLYGNMLAALKN